MGGFLFYGILSGEFIMHSSQQSPKLTFFGGRQLATEIFFSVAIWKNVVAKKCQ